MTTLDIFTMTMNTFTFALLENRPSAQAHSAQGTNVWRYVCSPAHKHSDRTRDRRPQH